MADTVAPENPALQRASESQIKELWTKLQADSVALEATDPQGAVTRYQQFFEQGAYRFPAVGIQISLRIARIWQIDIGDYDKALEIYDWALATYKNRPEIGPLQQGRLAAEQAQRRAENAQKPAPSKVPGTAPLAVPGVPSLTIPIPRPFGGAKFGVGIPSATAPVKFGSQIGPPAGQLLSVAPPRVVLSGNALGWRSGAERCVTALAQQKDGTVWVATEDAGVWRYDPAAVVAKRWKQFTAKEGLGDDTAYALAVDQQGRLWAGTLNHGVSVWNGERWQNYGVLEGPLGERVFDIAVCPTDGDVWLATNAGITRYSVQKDNWSYITRADGLPSDQIQALAFDKQGNIVVGTQCDGVTLGQARDSYKTWQGIKGSQEMPVTATGQGLPTSLINDVLVATDGTIYAATTTGLAWSSDGGQKWAYVRGQDYTAKVKGLYGGPPTGWKQEKGAVLAEDYVSCLAEDKNGHLWLGHWRAGSEQVELVGDSSLKVKSEIGREANGFVKAILPLSEGSSEARPLVLIARYNAGIAQSIIASGKKSGTLALAASKGIEEAVSSNTQSVFPRFPRVAAAPTLDDIQNLSKRISAPTSSLQPGAAAFLSEDWRTQGDWVGRYGRYYAMLCAVQAPLDDTYASVAPIPDIVPQLGPHIEEGDSIRRWLHWVKTDNSKTLYNPLLGYRRQAEWDDHGETYPLEFQGPDLWSSLQVPPGTWRITCYFFNKDGHGPDNSNRNRDYLLELRHETIPLPTYPSPTDDEQVTDEWLKTHFGAYYAARTKLIIGAQKARPLVSARVRDFWGGVHKSFVLQGPATYWLRVARNGSFNTIMSSIEWDNISPGYRWEDAPGLSWMGGKFNPPDPDVPAPVDPFLLDKILNGEYHEPTLPTSDDQKRAATVAAARALWDAADAGVDKQGGADYQTLARLTAYRAAQANGASSVLLDNWRWKMAMWNDADRLNWNDQMQRTAKTFALPQSQTLGSQPK